MIKIISVCDNYKHFSEAIEEYKKRLGKKVQIITLKPSKKDIGEALKAESEEIIKNVDKKNSFVILLYIDGKQMSTMEFYEFIEKKSQNFKDIIFIIGGVYGVNESVKNISDLELSFGKMTFTHIEALAILLEQIYRIETIKQNKNYHY